MNWRSLIAGVAASAFLGLNLTALSADSCGPRNSCDWNACEWDSCGCHFSVGADFLWWKPCVDGLDSSAVIETDDEQDVDFEALCPEWEPGVRVWLEFPDVFCGVNVGASYTYFKSSDSASQEFDGQDDDNGIISLLFFNGFSEELPIWGEGEQHWDLYYNEWDILFSYEIGCGACQHFTPYFGVAGIVFDQKLTAEFENDDGDEGEFDWTSDYWGVGLRAGSHYQLDLNCGISIYANAQATLLAGEAHTKNEQEVAFSASDPTEEEIEFKDDDCCHFVPGYRIAAGFAYTSCWCDWDISARLGYEFVYWHNLPNHRVFLGDDVASASHSTSPHTRSVALHGLVAVCRSASKKELVPVSPTPGYMRV